MKLSQVILCLSMVLLFSCRESIVKSKETLPVENKEQPIHAEPKNYPEKPTKKNKKSNVVDTLKPKMAIKNREQFEMKPLRNIGR